MFMPEKKQMIELFNQKAIKLKYIIKIYF